MNELNSEILIIYYRCRFHGEMVDFVKAEGTHSYIWGNWKLEELGWLRNRLARLQSAICNL